MVGSVPDPEKRLKKLLKIRDSAFEVRQKDLMARYMFERNFVRHWGPHLWGPEETHVHRVLGNIYVIRCCSNGV